MVFSREQRSNCGLLRAPAQNIIGRNSVFSIRGEFGATTKLQVEVSLIVSQQVAMRYAAECGEQ